MNQSLANFRKYSFLRVAWLLGCLLVPTLSHAEAELAPIIQKSNPLGFFEALTTAIEIGKSVDTLTPTLSQDGYRFGYWTAGDTRLADSGGRSLTTATLLVEGPLTLTAHYFPEDQDTDNDQVPDWFEYRNFGDLNQTGTDDPDGDGFSNNRESQLGQEATIYDLVEDGGSSFAASTTFTYADPSQVKQTIKSDPEGFIESMTSYDTHGSTLNTTDLQGAKNGYHFAYWSVNGERQASPSGLAKSQVDYVLDTEKTIIAHYIPSEQDSDSDGIMDWFEFNQFGDLNQSGTDDPDGDGFSNNRENQLGQEATIFDEVADGGISFAASTKVTYLDTLMKDYVIKSDPEGFIDAQSGAALSGNSVNSPSLHGEKDGYHFAYWSLNGERQATSRGLARNQVDFAISESSQLVAHYLPSDQDSDEDGLMDWYELNQFGDLNQSGTGDPDGDGFSNNRENQLGQEAMIPDSVEDGGISFASSTAAFYYIQSYDYLDGIDLNNTITMGLQPAGLEIGTFRAIDSVWDPARIRGFRYQLVSGYGSGDNSKFRIVEDILKTAEPLVPGSYSIRVRAYNFLNIFTEKSFIITAETPPPPPNRAPSFIHEPDGEVLEIHIKENESFITQLEAIDPDNDSLTFLLDLDVEEKDHANLFLDPVSGELSFKKAPDFENPQDRNQDNFYEIQALVTDGQLSDRISIRVRVDDVDEISPLGDFQLLFAQVEENQKTYTFAGRFFSPSNVECVHIEYKLVPGNGDDANGAFRIYKDQLFTTRELDFESSPTLSIRVSAQKENQEPLEKIFLIRVLDAFENTAPTFVSFNGAQSGTIELIENQTFITQLEAADIDDQILSFHLSDSADANLFEISETTGILKFIQAPDFESPSDANGNGIYEVSVLVSDGLSFAHISLSIHILNSLDEDTDGDGLDDQTELALGTDPKKADSDGDGFPDGMEVTLETDPLSKENYPGSDSGFDFARLEFVQANDDTDGAKHSQIEFNAEEGNTYYFSLDGVDDARGLGIVDFEFTKDLGQSISSATLADATPISLNAFLGDSESEEKELKWTATQSGLAKVILADFEGAAQLTLFEENDNSRKQVGEDFLSASNPTMKFLTEAGKSYLIQIEMGLNDLSTLDSISSSDPKISVKMIRGLSAPQNDAFANRLPIRKNTLSIEGSFDQAGSELGEPFHADLPPPQRSVWWKWNAPSDGILSLKNQSTAQTHFAVYAGWSVDDLIRLAKSDTNDLFAPVILEVKEGVEYAIVASRYAGETGELQFDFTFSQEGESVFVENDDLANAPLLASFSGTVSGTNLGATGEVDEPNHGDSSPPVNSIWWKWQAPADGKLTVDTHGSNLDTILAVYLGDEISGLKRLAQNDDHSQASTSEVEVFVEKGKSYSVAVDGFGSSTGQVILNFSFDEEKSPPPSNDYPSTAFVINSLDSSIYSNNKFATGKANLLIEESVSQNDGSVWWKWTASSENIILVDTLGSEIDTVLTLCEMDDSGVLNLLKSNDNYFGAASLIWLKPQIGQTYYFCITGRHGQQGNFTLNLKVYPDYYNNHLTGEEILAIYNAEVGTLPPTLSRIGNSQNLGESTSFRINNYITGRSYKIWHWDTLPHDKTYGAEDISGVKIKTLAKNNGFQSLHRVNGGKAYHLSCAVGERAWLELEELMIFEPLSYISWWGMLDGDPSYSFPRIEYSLNDGISWDPLPGADSSDNAQFSDNRILLRELSGKVARIRFGLVNLDASSKTAHWYLDEIAFEGVHNLSSPEFFSIDSEIFNRELSQSPMQVFFVEKTGSSPTNHLEHPFVLIPYHQENIINFFDATHVMKKWYESSWYGYFMKPGHHHWMFSPTRGWQYFGRKTLGGGWIYDAELGWLWTTENIYPWMYQASLQSWTYDYSNFAGKRYFHCPEH